MGGDGQDVVPPVGRQPQQRPHAEPPGARDTGPLHRGQPPVEVALPPGHVHFGVARPVVGLLVVDDPLQACRHQAGVGVIRPGLRLDGQGRHEGAQPFHHCHEIVGTDFDAVLAGHEQQVAKPPTGQLAGFRLDLVDGQRPPRHVQEASEAAVGARGQARVGHVQRCEQPHGATEPADGERARELRELLQPFRGGGAEQRGQVPRPHRPAGGTMQRRVDVGRAGR